MGRWSYSNKIEADGLKKIETSFLKKYGYLDDYKSGSIVWTNNYSNKKNIVGLQSSFFNGDDYLRIYYTQTDTDEKNNFDYKIPLTTTSCNYGGKRYWFTCPWYKNGNYCGRRVAVLYKNGDYFACRHCNNLTYSSRNLSGHSKIFGNVCLPDVERAREQVKRITYNGKYTKKYNRYIKLNNKLDDAFIGMSMLLTRDIKKIKV